MKPRAQAPVSDDYTRKDSLGGGNSFQTHEWDGDHGGVQDWINKGPDYIRKRIIAPERSTPFNVDPQQHEAQEHRDENDNLKKASQQQNSPILSQAKRIMAPERSTPFNVDPQQHEAQEHHDENDNSKKPSQQQNSETHTPIASQANPLEEDESRARRANVSSNHDRERKKVR